MLRFFFDVLTLYLPPIEENGRLKRPRSCILRDRSLLQLTEVSDVYRNWPITFLARSTGHRVTPTSFGSEFLAMHHQQNIINISFSLKKPHFNPLGTVFSKFHWPNRTLHFYDVTCCYHCNKVCEFINFQSCINM